MISKKLAVCHFRFSLYLGSRTKKEFTVFKIQKTRYYAYRSQRSGERYYRKDKRSDERYYKK
ncbi:Hypothetical predicted protein, partial [Pelobates cultripes]